jgi:RsiW-degrading membrane proteinase PrsW (M82 family)
MMGMLAVAILVFDGMAACLWLRWIAGRHNGSGCPKHRPANGILFFMAGLLSMAILAEAQVYVADSTARTLFPGDGFPFQLLFAAVPAELAKLVMFIAVSKAFRTIRAPLDAVVQGALVGLGFAIIHNFSGSLDQGYLVLLGRSFLMVLAHMTTAAIAAIASSARRFWKLDVLNTWLVAAGGLCTAAMLHAIMLNATYRVPVTGVDRPLSGLVLAISGMIVLKQLMIRLTRTVPPLQHIQQSQGSQA